MVERFSINSVDGTPIPLTGAQVNVFPLSERWVRIGAHANGGAGDTSILGNRVNVNYGLLGLRGGFQYPARVTPFVEGHVEGGFLAAQLKGTVQYPGGSLENTSGTTWLYGRGVDAGAEIYTVGRLYVSASLGWMRSTWASPDYTSMIQNPNVAVGLHDVTSDSFIWKLGLGL